MTEDGQTVETEVSQTAPAEVTSVIGNDGTFSDGWVNALDEDIRGEKCIQTHKNLNSAMRSLVNATKMIGTEKIPIPKEGSPQEVWDAYYKAGGRPDTPDDYKLEYPKDMPVEQDKAMLDNFKAILHKNGGSAKLALELYNWYNSYVKDQIINSQQVQQEQQKQLIDGLTKEWGNAFEQKKHLGNITIEQGVGGDEQFRERITQKFGNDVDFIKFVSNLGSKFTESSSIPTSTLIPTPNDIQIQIDEEMGHPAYGADYMSKGFTKRQHDNQIEKVQRLFVEKSNALKGKS